MCHAEPGQDLIPALVAGQPLFVGIVSESDSSIVCNILAKGQFAINLIMKQMPSVGSFVLR